MKCLCTELGKPCRLWYEEESCVGQRMRQSEWQRRKMGPAASLLQQKEPFLMHYIWLQHTKVSFACFSNSVTKASDCYDCCYGTWSENWKILEFLAKVIIWPADQHISRMVPLSKGLFSTGFNNKSKPKKVKETDFWKKLFFWANHQYWTMVMMLPVEQTGAPPLSLPWGGGCV